MSARFPFFRMHDCHAGCALCSGRACVRCGALFTRFLRGAIARDGGLECRFGPACRERAAGQMAGAA